MPDRAETQAPAWLLPSLAGLLVCSGLCALTYQVLWLRLLALIFGVTVHAAATVLSSFMAGLAIGSLLAGKLADRASSPLRIFGLVELGIGGCALVTPLMLTGLQDLVAATAPYLPDSLALATLIRLVSSSAVLLIPTALMGATMPLVTTSLRSRAEGLGPKLGVLYASNTAGAILGAALAGFYLLPELGASRSFRLAAALNAVVGTVALVLARYLSRAPRTVSPRDEPSGKSVSVTASVEPAVAVYEAPRAPRFELATGGGMVLAASAISGFASLALEVIWFRLLGIFIGPTSYTFTVVLATVLSGIALGSAFASVLLRWRALDHLQGLALLQLLGAGLVLRSFAGLLVPSATPAWLQHSLTWLGVGFAAPAATMSLAVVLPASIFFGLSFPIGLRLWTHEGTEQGATGRRVGVFYSVNVAGGILGSLAAGFVLLPLFGSRASLVAMAALYLLAGVGLQVTCARQRPFLTGVAASLVVGLLIHAQSVPNPMDVMRRRIYTGRPVIWEDEGTQTTVAVAGAVNDRVLFLDGRHQANDSASMVFVHRRIGLLPAVLHPNPRRALVIGLGGGATPGGLSQYPHLSVDVVELSEGVIEAAGYFGHMNFDILQHPGVRIRADDGRSFLQRVREPYDVITADAIIPRHAGANSLNSVEYFRLVRRALHPRGVALHWNGGATEAEHKLILRAFVEVFPHATLWGDGSLMVGTIEPLVVSRSRLERLLEEPATRRVLGLMNVETVDHAVRIFKAGPDAIRTYLGAGVVLSDDRPLLEYFESLPQRPLELGGVSSDAATVFRP